MRKNGSSLGFRAGSLLAGPSRGGQRGTMSPELIEFRGPMGFRGPMEMTLTNRFVEHRSPPFFEIISKSGENCGIFLFFFGVHKAEGAQYLSWPRAHVWFAVPLQTINEYIYCFSWQIIGCSLINLLIIADGNLQRISDRSFVTAYEPIIILKSY